MNDNAKARKGDLWVTVLIFACLLAIPGGIIWAIAIDELWPLVLTVAGAILFMAG